MDFLNRLPIGIQDFEKLREEGCFFVDKTGLLYKLVHSGNGYFFCRPRYFGKTLFVSMLEAYFRGRRDLFEGLAIESMEKEWNGCEVLRVDFSSGLYRDSGTVEAGIEAFLQGYEEIYGKPEVHTTYGRRFERLIQEAYKKSGKPVAVLVDDYDKPVLDALFTGMETHNMDVLREFYSALCGNDFYLKFVFVTGISKFASVNIFNGKNQLKDISTYPAFSSLCGFSEMDVQRLLTTAKGLRAAPAKRGRGKASEKKNQDVEKPEETVTESDAEMVGADQVFALLDRWYGGYRFSDDGDMLFNPYSIMNCLDFNAPENFASGDIRHQFWIQTGQPNVLVNMLKKNDYDLFSILYGIKVDREELMEYRWTENDVLPLIYQSGYLTRTTDDESGSVMLAMPNAEIAEGMIKALLSEFTGIGTISKSCTEIDQMKYLLSTKNVAGFIVRFEAALGEKKFGPKVDYEYVYKLAFHVIANLVGKEVSSDTNSDVMFSVDDRDGKPLGYVFQLKADKGLDLDEVKEDAFARIEERGFAERFDEQGIPCKKVVVVFSSKKGGVAGWTAK
ncbi:MAG: AAA family ATPase [Treponema sp.]|nr:AAA family ATPase [Treponema sp.]